MTRELNCTELMSNHFEFLKRRVRKLTNSSGPGSTLGRVRVCSSLERQRNASLFKLYPTCRFAPLTLSADMIVICTGCGGLRVTRYTGSRHLIHQSAQLLIVERPSTYMVAGRWPFWHTERVRELGVVARRHVGSS